MPLLLFGFGDEMMDTDMVSRSPHCAVGLLHAFPHHFSLEELLPNLPEIDSRILMTFRTDPPSQALLAQVA